MTIQEWLTKTYYPSKSGIIRSNKVKCKDGFEIGVQASIWHYCTPRATLRNGERYKKLELGYANAREDLLEEYRDGVVYPYVPVDLVNEVLAKHGGIENCEKGSEE